MSRDGIDIAIRTGSTQTGEVIAPRSAATVADSMRAYLKKRQTEASDESGETSHHHHQHCATAQRLAVFVDGKSVVRHHGQLRASSTAILRKWRWPASICRVHDLIAAPLVQRGDLIGVTKVPIQPGGAGLRDDAATAAPVAENSGVRGLLGGGCRNSPTPSGSERVTLQVNATNVFPDFRRFGHFG